MYNISEAWPQDHRATAATATLSGQGQGERREAEQAEPFEPALEDEKQREKSRRRNPASGQGQSLE